MPVRSNQKMYFQLQGKLAREQLDYTNMPNVSNIIAGNQGLITKFDNTQYNDKMAAKYFEALASVKDHKAVNLKDFKPLKSEMVIYKNTEPIQVANQNMGNRPNKIVLAPVIPLPSNSVPQVRTDFESELARYYLKKSAPNQNPSTSLISLDDILDVLGNDDSPEHEYNSVRTKSIHDSNKKKEKKKRNERRQAKQERFKNRRGIIETRSRSLKGVTQTDKEKRKKRGTNPYLMNEDNFEL